MPNAWRLLSGSLPLSSAGVQSCPVAGFRQIVSPYRGSLVQSIRVDGVENCRPPFVAVQAVVRFVLWFELRYV